MRMGAVYPRQTNTCLPIFNCLQAKRATRQRRPLLQLKTQRLMLLARRWKRLLQLCIAEWMRMGALYPRQTNTCLPIFKRLQAERATRQRRPLFQYVRQQSRLPARRWKRSLQLCCLPVALPKRPFSDGNQSPDCRQMVLCLHRWRAGNSTILRIDRHLQPIVVSAQLSLESREAFPNNGNTYLPWRARGPFWCPPSEHFFPSLRFIYPSQSGYIWVDAPFWI